MEDINRRVDYYLAGLKSISESNIKVPHKYALHSGESFKPNELKVLSIRDMFFLTNTKNQHVNFKYYADPIIDIMNSNRDLWSYQRKNVLFRWGDDIQNNIEENMFYITKARTCDNKNGVILNLNKNRHWASLNQIKRNDIVFDKKNSILSWRGATTGKPGPTNFKDNRLLAVTKMINLDKCDVAFSNIVQDVDLPDNLIKGGKHIHEMLKNKYLLSLEGNDVASDLKWKLYSNSVVFMRKPRVVSWAMEDTLEPFVHYIPLLDDFSDIEEKIEWAESNQEKCKEIASNSTKFINQFLNTNKEKLIEKLVLENYVKKMSIDIS